MYGQYSVHILQIHFEFQIFIDIVSISFISMKIYQILLQLQLNLFSSIGKFENWTRCDVLTIFSPRCTNTLWISNFHCNCICILTRWYHHIIAFNLFVDLKITFIVMYGQYILNTIFLFKYCDVWTIFSPRLQIHFEFQIFIDIVSISFISMKIYQILLQLQLNLFINWKITFIVMYGQYSVHILQIHFEFQIFIDIVSISFISMKIYQILLQLQLNLFSSIGKLHLLWCMDNIQSTFTNTLWISNFHWYCIYIIHLIEDLSDISPASTQTT